MFQLLLVLKSEEGYQHASSLIETNLEELCITVEHYFPSLSTQVYDWVRDPYFESFRHPENLSLKEEEELCELQSDRALKIRFTNLSLDKFWNSVKEEHPTIHKKAINILLQFSISYMCEQAFSCLTSVESKDINRLLPVENEIRLSSSIVRAPINYLCS